MYHSRLAMHQIFQKELYRFRIKTAKEFLSSLKTASTPISTNPNEPLKMNAQVQGIGPTFKLILKVQNISSTSPSINLFITFAYDEKLYKIATTYIEVSFQMTRARLDILSLSLHPGFISSYLLWCPVSSIRSAPTSSPFRASSYRTRSR